MTGPTKRVPNNPKSYSSVSDWYRKELNTSTLIHAVMSNRPARSLSAEDIWWLTKLTWITATGGQPVELHWQQLKIPALAHIFKKTPQITEDLDATLKTMSLPPVVVAAAAQRTGFSNAYRAYRNSLLHWCEEYKADLRKVIAAAQSLGSNDQGRYDLAQEISSLPKVPTPEGVRQMAAANLLTPLIACLDPKRRFPVVNGETGVKTRLAKLRLTGRDLEEQVRGLIGLIGRFGIADAFDLDTMDDNRFDAVLKRISDSAKSPISESVVKKLRDRDESEIRAVLKAREVVSRRRHNLMTRRISECLPNLSMSDGEAKHYLYDIVIFNYDSSGRDLLIEAKPDPDKGSLRIAIGQLFDYQRFLKNQAGTDLAILTITRPPKDYVELLQDLQITSLWFTDATCNRLSGEGKSWRALKRQLAYQFKL